QHGPRSSPSLRHGGRAVIRTRRGAPRGVEAAAIKTTASRAGTETRCPPNPLPTFHDPLRTLRAPRLGALRLGFERGALKQPPTDRARTFEQLGSRGHAPKVVVLVLPDQRLFPARADPLEE